MKVRRFWRTPRHRFYAARFDFYTPQHRLHWAAVDDFGNLVPVDTASFWFSLES